MKRFEIFRSKDPQVSAWLQKNGFRNHRSNSYEDTGRNAAQSNKKETELQTKEVRFDTEEYVLSKIPSPVYKQAIPELKINEAEAHTGRGCLKNMDEIPPVGLQSQSLKQIEEEKPEPAQTAFINTKGRKIRSFSSPPNNELCNDHANATRDSPSLTRRYSTLSLSSDRPSNIPVLIRNNNIRLRKYSCPEYYTSSLRGYGQREDKESERNGFERKALNVSSNQSQKLAKSTNQVSPPAAVRERNLHEQNFDQRREANRGKSITDIKAFRGENKYATIRKNDSYRKEFKDSHVTDLNANEISHNPRGRMYGCFSSESSEEDLGFNHYEENSLKSYTLEVLPKPITRNNFPSSMYNGRGAMLSWLGEVNRNNPQLWS